MIKKDTRLSELPPLEPALREPPSELPPLDPARSEDMEDDWARCNAEAVVAALSARYRFSRANAVQLLRDEGILRPRVEEAEAWGSEEDDDEEEEDGDVIIPMPGQALVSVGSSDLPCRSRGACSRRAARPCGPT